MLPATLRRRSPRLWADPLESIEREFGHLLNRIAPMVDDEQNGRSLTASYPVDIREDEEHIYIEAEMPGFTKDQVDVTIDQGILTISAERESREKPAGTQHLNERRFTRVARSFTLPTSVDDDKVEARLSDGVLHLTLAKSEAVKPRKISVS